jgi:hypothetical protein
VEDDHRIDEAVVVVRDEEDRTLSRNVLIANHFDTSIEKADHETYEPDEGAPHNPAAAAAALSFAGNRTFRKAPMAKTRTTKRTVIPAR